MAYFVTSDQHFFHEGILDFTDRPFDDVDEMNDGLVDAWNNVVSENDVVYHLGDFSFAGYDRTASVLSQLNGKIVLHKGNHDRDNTYKRLLENGLISEYHPVGQYVKSHKHQIWLTHYPMEIGVRPRKWSVSGHIHENENSMVNQINVGVDSPHDIVRKRDFGEPVPFEELVTLMDELTPDIEELWRLSKE